MTHAQSMLPAAKLSAEEQFFFDHSGYGYDIGTEPAEGRTRCAIALAAAEAVYLRAHQLADVRIEWQEDREAAFDQESDIRRGYMAPEDAAQVHEWCALWIGDWPAESLGGIADADDDYRRVIRAELALECVEKLAAACAGA